MSVDVGAFATASTLTPRVAGGGGSGSGPGGSELALATARGLTPTGLVEHPSFFSGFAAYPVVLAAGILAVADLAGTTYRDATIFRDPVITASGDRLRLESFSGENGVHARLDLLPDGIDAGDVGHGTTNVDVNATLRLALAQVGRGELLHVAVGGEGLRVATPQDAHHERPVDLPERWIRGLAEVGPVAAAMTPLVTLRASEATAFLGSLPSGLPGPTLALGAIGGRLRPLPPSRASLLLAGTGRLGPLGRLVRHLTSLEVFTHADGFSGWVAHLPGARFTLLLTPEVYRGFSGEGRLLTDLAAGGGAGGSGGSGDAAHRLLEHLAWEPVIDPDELGRAAGLSPAEVTAGLAVLAASGRVGFDLTAQRWFHRELPLDLARVERQSPRLVKAQALLDAGAVVRDRAGNGIGGEKWIVGHTTHRHWVTVGPTGTECTCEWWARYRGGRGPCSHELAVRLADHAHP